MERALARPSALDVAIAVVLATSQGVAVALSGDDHGSSAVAAACSFFVLALAWRRRTPVVVIAIFVLGATVQDALLTHSADTTFSFAGYLLASYSVGRHCAGRRGVVGLAIGLLGSVEELVRFWPTFTASEFVFSAVVIAGGWLAGRALQERHRLLVISEAHAADLARRLDDEAQAAVLAERARIARELHDAVAHGVSVMVIQAGAAEEMLDRDPERARSALRAVQELGSEAVGELRNLLGILRDPGERATLAPQPRLKQLDALVAQVEDAGLPVTVSVDGPPRDLPRGTDQCAYRIVQEALTNVLRHAGARSCRVLLSYEDTALRIEVTDDGVGPNGNGTSGHGIVGMRERVALYGGTLEVGALNGRGFAVRARIPTQ